MGKKKQKDKSEGVDFDKIFTEMQDFIQEYAEKSPINHALYGFAANSGKGQILNELLTDKKVFVPTETRRLLYKFMNRATQDMMCWYFEYKELLKNDSKKNN